MMSWDEDEPEVWGVPGAMGQGHIYKQDGPVIVGTYTPASSLAEKARELAASVNPEVIVTDPETGGKKGQKLQRFSLIPRDFLWALASHYGVGAKKYEDRNWERGYKWSLSQDAAERHLNQWLEAVRTQQPQMKYDEETGTHHLIAAIWHLIALFVFDKRDLGTNDIQG
jgi:hypothetical protein